MTHSVHNGIIRYTVKLRIEIEASRIGLQAGGNHDVFAQYGNASTMTCLKWLLKISQTSFITGCAVASALL